MRRRAETEDGLSVAVRVGSRIRQCQQLGLDDARYRRIPRTGLIRLVQLHPQGPRLHHLHLCHQISIAETVHRSPMPRRTARTAGMAPTFRSATAAPFNRRAATARSSPIADEIARIVWTVRIFQSATLVRQTSSRVAATEPRSLIP